MDNREKLLRKYDELEASIERSAQERTWDLADWLHESTGGWQLTLADVASRGVRTERWLATMVRVAATTAPNRLPSVSCRVYQEALQRNGWDIEKANQALKTKGTRLRDHSPMESVAALGKQLDQRKPEEIAGVLAEQMARPEVADAVQAKIARTPRLSNQIAHNELDRARRQSGRPEPERAAPSSRDRPEHPVDPWDEVNHAIALLRKARGRLTEEHWALFDGLPDLVAGIARDADEAAEFLHEIAVTARDKTAAARLP